MRFMLIVFSLISSINASATHSDPYVFKMDGAQYAFVAANACILNGGEIVESRKYLLCQGGKYDGLIPDWNVTGKDGVLSVSASGCTDEGGRVKRTKKYWMCIGGSYNGFISVEPN